VRRRTSSRFGSAQVLLRRDRLQGITAVNRTSPPASRDGCDEASPERKHSLLPALVAFLPVLVVASTALSLIGME
jgi:hypothetical protein